MVLRQLADGEEISNETLIQCDLFIECKIDGKSVEKCLHVAQFFPLGNLRHIHHVGKAEESIDVYARLHVSGKLK